jgi:hypothetical protein
MIDPDLTDALAGAIGADAPRPGQWPSPATAGARRLKSFRDAVRAFLEETPGEASVSELRAALDELDL